MLSVRVSQDVACVFDYHVLKPPACTKAGHAVFPCVPDRRECFFHIFICAPGATQIAEYSAIIAISMFAIETQSALTCCPSRLFECRIAAFVAR
jgi:hypothetical protein